MKILELPLREIQRKVLPIGFEGEQNHTRVVFESSEIFDEYPDAVASLAISSVSGVVYPRDVAISEHSVIWDVSASDCYAKGMGEYQLTFANGEEIIKTFVGRFTVNRSLAGDNPPPDPITDWIEDANAVLGSLENISASAHDLEYGEPATAEIEDVGGHKNINIGIPKGDPGPQGEPGEGIPSGGIPGQALIKKSGTDYDTEWGNVAADLPAVTSSDNGKVLEVVSGEWGVGTEKAPTANPAFTGSISMGRRANTTVGQNSVAEGNDTTASGDASHAEGWFSSASGIASHAEGGGVIANGPVSHAEGMGNGSSDSYTYGAFGPADHSEGINTIANSGNQGGAHAEGYMTSALAAGAHAEGSITRASGTSSHSEGNYTNASNNSAHAEGEGTVASGPAAHSEGVDTEASGNYGAHTEGYSSVASGNYGAHAEGDQTTASGDYGAHAEGDSTTASSYSSHAEGRGTIASGYCTHAEGYETVASGAYSHVSGEDNVVDSYDSYSEWVPGTEYHVGDKVKITTAQDDETTVDTYVCIENNSDATFNSAHWYNLYKRMTYAEIVGNGLDSEYRSNARALDWDGNEYLNGDLYVKCSPDSTGGSKVAKESQLPNVMTGADGTNPGASGLVPAPTATDNEKFLRGDGTWSPSNAISDVQVNGASVVNNGVANIPMASDAAPGVLKYGSSSTGLQYDASGYLKTAPAVSERVKAGTDAYRPIVPERQHESVFYGLAKLAGQDMASSSNPVGTFTDAAKKAIKRMLGIYDEWELIGEFSVAEDSEHVDFITDSNGQAFSVREMFVQAWLPQATTQRNDYVASKGLCWASGGVAAIVGSPTNRYMANGAVTYMEYKMELICGNVYTIARSASSTANSQTPQSTTSDQNDIVGIGGFRIQQYNATSTLVPAGTRVKIFGIRI